MAKTPWRIVVASNEATARIEQKTVLNGLTGQDGKVSLSDADMDLLRSTYDQAPGRVWLIQRGKIRQITLAHESEDWDNGQRLEQAMDAMGYSDTLGVTGDAITDDTLRALSRQEQITGSGVGTLKKLKG